MSLWLYKASDLRKHEQIHKLDQEALNRTLDDDDLKFTCGVCDYKFLSQDILNFHKNRGHKDFSFDDVRMLSFEKKDNRYKCKLCYASVKLYSSLKTNNFEKSKIVHSIECNLRYRMNLFAKRNRKS